MGQHTLEVGGLLLFLFILAGIFGSKMADDRGRPRLALALAGLTVLIAGLLIAWEAAMYSLDGWPVRRALIIGWSVVTLVTARRFVGMALDLRAEADWEKREKRRPRGY